MTADSLQRFIFDNLDVRGQWLQLEQSYQQALSAHNYPRAIKQWLGQLMAATTLFGNNLKFDGTITLQLRSEGPVSLLMAQCTHHQSVRAIAQFDEQLDYLPGGLQSAIEKGTLVLTVDPEDGQRYQGIVPLEHDSLAKCLEAYFNQSEQLETRIWLAADDERAAGMLLQQLPAEKMAGPEQTTECWTEIIALSDTVKDDELLQLDSESLLFRLFNEHEVRLFEPSEIKFECHCSQERAEFSVNSLGEQDAYELLAEQGIISIDCDFCGTKYQFEQPDLDQLFSADKH